MWGNGCKCDRMYRCGETAVSVTGCTGVGKRFKCDRMYRCGETAVCVTGCTGVGKRL